MKKFCFPLSNKEHRALTVSFSPKRDGQFHYFDFLKYFTSQSASSSAEPGVFSRSTYLLRSKVEHCSATSLEHLLTISAILVLRTSDHRRYFSANSCSGNTVKRVRSIRWPTTCMNLVLIPSSEYLSNVHYGGSKSNKSSGQASVQSIARSMRCSAGPGWALPCVLRNRSKSRRIDFLRRTLSSVDFRCFANLIVNRKKTSWYRIRLMLLFSHALDLPPFRLLYSNSSRLP